MDCPWPRCHHGNCPSRCSNYIYLRVIYSDRNFSDTYIKNTSEASSDTKHIFFDLPTFVTGFDLELLTAEATCINVSRVLVYRYECPAQIRPLYRPATQAPVNGSVLVTPNFTNICFSGFAVVSTLTCTSEGKWLECDPGDNEFEYELMCKGKTLESCECEVCSIAAFLKARKQLSLKRCRTAFRHCPILPFTFSYTFPNC